jgi:hydroxymethylpyrimidine/phosphomethylpyrimidine kinase
MRHLFSRVHEKQGRDGRGCEMPEGKQPEIIIITGDISTILHWTFITTGSLTPLKARNSKANTTTGCAFSAALTALLALGHAPLESARQAKEFVNHAIKGIPSRQGYGVAQYIKPHH